MKILVPLDGSAASTAAIAHVKALARKGVPVQALLLHVQVCFSRHISQFSRRAARDALRAERSGSALAPAMDELLRAKIPFVALTACGERADCIAATAARERADEIVLGIDAGILENLLSRTEVPVTVLRRGRASRLGRYALPAGIAGAAALLLTAD